MFRASWPLSSCLSVRPPVRHNLDQNGASFKITKSSLWIAPSTLALVTKFRALRLEGSPQTRAVKEAYLS